MGTTSSVDMNLPCIFIYTLLMLVCFPCLVKKNLLANCGAKKKSPTNKLIITDSSSAGCKSVTRLPAGLKAF